MERMKRVTRRTAPDAIAAMEDFDNSTGSLRGRVIPLGMEGHVYTGRLEGEWCKRLNDDVARRNVAYVVWSYQTPIAWVTRTGKVRKVTDRFSMTTSHHQGLLYRLGD